jgi:hypothetical protein
MGVSMYNKVLQKEATQSVITQNHHKKWETSLTVTKHWLLLFLAYFPYFEKNICRLMRSRCCPCIPSIAARQRLGKRPLIVARQRLGKRPLIVGRQGLAKIPLSMLSNGSVKIPLSMLSNGSVKIPLLLGNGWVKISLLLLGNGLVKTLPR